MTNIIPRYRMILQYNIHPERQERYYRYMIADFVPKMRKVGLYMLNAWHIAYGEYPERQVELVCENIHTLRAVLEGEAWREAEDLLMSYTTDYTRKIVHFENRFQF